MPNLSGTSKSIVMLPWNLVLLVATCLKQSFSHVNQRRLPQNCLLSLAAKMSTAVEIKLEIIYLIDSQAGENFATLWPPFCCRKECNSVQGEAQFCLTRQFKTRCYMWDKHRHYSYCNLTSFAFVDSPLDPESRAS